MKKGGREMKNSVIIKGNKYGIILILDSELPFEELKDEIIQKFKDSAGFFGNAQMALSIEGRKLSAEEEKELLDIISTYTTLSIICVVDSDSNREEFFKKVNNFLETFLGGVKNPIGGAEMVDAIKGDIEIMIANKL